ncbi:unnamed protein product [Rotaria sordida]|uniref:glutathione transferase n=1 Tax=Rotaria sordida TaxID=392033 RepID=A0A819Y2H8_9BILA|nr:unnamed protein product [Rotaria sordida]
MTLDQIPVLEFESGKDNFEQAKVDAVADTIRDLAVAFVPNRRAPDEVKREELLKKFFADELPKHLQNFEVLAKLCGNGGSFFVGNHLTWADSLFNDLGEILLNFDENCLNN